MDKQIKLVSQLLKLTFMYKNDELDERKVWGGSLFTSRNAIDDIKR